MAILNLDSGEGRFVAFDKYVMEKRLTITRKSKMRNILIGFLFSIPETILNKRAKYLGCDMFNFQFTVFVISKNPHRYMQREMRIQV